MAQVDDAESSADRRVVAKRPRPVISCLECRRKKLKCDRLLPCQQCLKSGKPSTCQYAEGQEPEIRKVAESESSAKRQKVALTSSDAPNDSATASTEISDLHTRVKNLEEALKLQNGHNTSTQSAIQSATINTTQATSSAIERNQCISAADERVKVECVDTPVLTYFEMANAFVDRVEHRTDNDDIQDMAANFRAMSSALSDLSHRAKSMHTNLEDVVSHMLRLLPREEICIEMIGVYFRNFEHCGRVLHKPTFLAQYEAFRSGDFSKEYYTWFVPMLVLVVSIASSLNTLPECHNPQLHGDENNPGTVQLVQNWLNLLPLSVENTVVTMQIKLLMMKPQVSLTRKKYELWRMSGQNVRSAMILLLHREPAKGTSFLQAEVRRKLWITTIEQDLFISIACGLPASCPRLNIRPPLNVADQDLLTGSEDRHQAQSIECWTDALCQHVLAQSFNDRLTAYALVSGDSTAPFGQVVENTRHLEQILRDLPEVFRLHHISDEASNTPGRLLAKMEIDLHLRRPLNACYAPFARLMPDDDRFKEARIPWIQSCLYIICFQDLFDPKYPMLEIPKPEGLWDFYYRVYEFDVNQGALATCLELQRLGKVTPAIAESAAEPFQGHILRSPAKVAGWTFDGMTKSLEDTLDPLVRRIGREGASVVAVVSWTIISESLRFRSSSNCSEHDAIKIELEHLVTTLKRQLHNEGIKVDYSNGGSAYRNTLSDPELVLSDIDWLVNDLRGDVEEQDVEDSCLHSFDFGVSFLE